MRRIETRHNLHSKNYVLKYHMTCILLGRVLADMQGMHADKRLTRKKSRRKTMTASRYVDANDAHDCVTGLQDHSAEAEFLEMYERHRGSDCSPTGEKLHHGIVDSKSGAAVIVYPVARCSSLPKKKKKRKDGIN